MAQKISKSFSKIGENIKLIRQVKKISQAEFASLFNLARPSVGAYEEERSEPKIETLIAIANYFRISIDTLLTKKLSVSEIYSFDRLNKKLDAVHRRELDTDKNEKVALITPDKFIEYLVQHKNTNWLLECPQVGIPLSVPGVFRVFEMAGLEMSIGSQGIKNGDFLICRKLEAKGIKSHVGKVLVIVGDGVSCRRVDSIEASVIHLIPDNPAFTSISIMKTEILEYWGVVGSFSTELSPPTRLDERLMNIEEELRKLKK